MPENRNIIVSASGIRFELLMNSKEELTPMLLKV
jgi:hypothetical protein